jgi:hypothetical protein
MKYLKMLVLIVAAFFAASSDAAVVHNTTLYSTEPTGISTYDGEMNLLEQYSVSSWTVDIYVLDDTDGYITITWNTNVGPLVVGYAVSPNATTWEQSYGPNVGWDPAFLALINYLYPL